MSKWFETIPRNWLIVEYLLDWNAYDSSWNWNNWITSNVTYINSDIWYVKERGNFNGSSSWINCGKILHNELYITISLFFEILPWANNGSIIAQRDTATPMTWEWDISYNTEWTVRFLIRSSTAYLFCKTPIWSIQTWIKYHLVVISDWTTKKVYIDWIELASINDNTALSIDDIRSQLEIWRTYIIWDYLANNTWLVRIYNRVLHITEINILYQEWLKKFWPSKLIWNNWSFTKYLPSSIPIPILDINWKNNWSNIFYDQSGNWNNATSNWVVTTIWLNKIISLNNQSITWSTTSFQTSIVTEKINNRFKLVVNPSYITTTWITSTTKDIANIMLFDVVLNNWQLEKLKYSNYITN